MAAYRAAEYAVPQAGIVMRIGAPDPALDRLIAAKGGAAFLTAANPGSERRTDEENRLLLGELRCALDAAGYGYMDGEGRDPSGDWPAERSLFVLGIARAEAVKLATRFAQNAFVWCAPGSPPELVVVAKWRLVLDTHVWLDWLAFADASVMPLKSALDEGRIDIFMDEPCEAELARVLAYPIGKQVADEGLQAARLAEARRSSRRPPKRANETERAALPRCSDRDDQKFLELALVARAHALVTKDRALLGLARRTPFRIVTPAALARLLAE
jgi:predicted nucleic acid-binding protein